MKIRAGIDMGFIDTPFVYSALSVYIIRAFALTGGPRAMLSRLPQFPGRAGIYPPGDPNRAERLRHLGAPDSRCPLARPGLPDHFGVRRVGL